MTTSSSPPSSTRRWTCRWARPAGTRTCAATRAAGSSPRSRTACAGCRPTGSISTRCIAPIPDTDVEETLSALTDLQRAGKIRAFGSSTFPPHQVVEAQWVSERRSLGRFSTEQPPYSLLARRVEADLLPVAQRYDLGVLPWSPLAGGWLTGRYRAGQDLPASHRHDRMPARYDMADPANQRKLAAADALAVLAEKAGLPLIHMALAFTLDHPAVTAPIIGPRTMEHLESQLGAADVTLPADVLDAIDEIVAPGETLSGFDEGYQAPALTDARLRRR